MTNSNSGSRLILVEGLTGSGKSIMAHTIARQLQYNGIAADWVHEGAVPHPFPIEVKGDVTVYMTEMRSAWTRYVDHLQTTGEVRVIEACYFNNLMENLMAHNVEVERILAYAGELQALFAPLDPDLIYLVQGDVWESLENNFKLRGAGFTNFVIDLTTSTPYAQVRGWDGYQGMLDFWEDFVDLTDRLYDRFPGTKIKIDNSGRDWMSYNQQVANHLSLTLLPDPKISADEAKRLVGKYRDMWSDREFEVALEGDTLTINLFLNVVSRLIKRGPNKYEAEGWPFEISFVIEENVWVSFMKIGGGNVDYLPLEGTTAEKVSSR